MFCRSYRDFKKVFLVVKNVSFFDRMFREVMSEVVYMASKTTNYGTWSPLEYVEIGLQKSSSQDQFDAVSSVTKEESGILENKDSLLALFIETAKADKERAKRRENKLNFSDSLSDSVELSPKDLSKKLKWENRCFFSIVRPKSAEPRLSPTPCVRSFVPVPVPFVPGQEPDVRGRSNSTEVLVRA